MPQTELAPVAEQDVSLTPQVAEALRAHVAQNASDAELLYFVQYAAALNLDPMAGQLYFFKSGNRVTIGTSIDGLRALAERSGEYLPGRAPEFQHDDNGNCIAATAYVLKFSRRDAKWHEVAATAWMEERRQDGSQAWKKMPRLMLAKCAEADALRRAFPERLRQADPVGGSLEPGGYHRIDPETGEVLDAEPAMPGEEVQPDIVELSRAIYGTLAKLVEGKGVEAANLKSDLVFSTAAQIEIEVPKRDNGAPYLEKMNRDEAALLLDELEGLLLAKEEEDAAREEEAS